MAGCVHGPKNHSAVGAADGRPLSGSSAGMWTGRDLNSRGISWATMSNRAHSCHLWCRPRAAGLHGWRLHCQDSHGCFPALLHCQCCRSQAGVAKHVAGGFIRAAGSIDRCCSAVGDIDHRLATPMPGQPWALVDVTLLSTISAAGCLAVQWLALSLGQTPTRDRPWSVDLGSVASPLEKGRSKLSLRAAIRYVGNGTRRSSPPFQHLSSVSITTQLHPISQIFPKSTPYNFTAQTRSAAVH